MSELIKKQVTDARALMEKAIDHCEGELQKIRAGKASPSICWMILWLTIMAAQPQAKPSKAV